MTLHPPASLNKLISSTISHFEILIAAFVKYFSDFLLLFLIKRNSSASHFLCLEIDMSEVYFKASCILYKLHRLFPCLSTQSLPIFLYTKTMIFFKASHQSHWPLFMGVYVLYMVLFIFFLMNCTYCL